VGKKILPKLYSTQKGENNMTAARLMKHNPAFLTEEELLTSFVVRKSELDLIMEIIRDNTGPVNQHVTIIAPRGMGKTMLVHRLALEVKNDDTLNQNCYTVVLPEELYAVASQGELWLTVLWQISNQEKENDKYRMQKKYDTLQTEQNERTLKVQALAALSEFAGQKKLLIIVENLQMLLGEQSSDDNAWDLRQTLMNNPEIMLVTTATTHFGEILHPEKANFELFREIVLSPLNTSDCRALWQTITGENLEDDRIRPIEILTGGSPRLLAILADFAIGKTLKELLDNLVVLIDDHTTYFKANVESLPPKERRIFVTLAELWEPSQAKQVAARCRLQVNTTSSLLKRLVGKGAVTQVGKEGRKHFYQITERLYNIYHLMRLSGKAADRVKALVRFMIPVYGESHVACALASEACHIDGDLRRSFIEGYRIILDQARQKEEIFNNIIESTPKKFFRLQEAETLNSFIKNRLNKYPITHKAVTDPDKSDAIAIVGKALEQSFDLIADGKYEEALKVYDQVIEQFQNSDNSAILEQVAKAYNAKAYETYNSRNFSQLDKAIQDAEKAVRLLPDNNNARHTLSCLLGMNGLWEKAFEQVAFFANDKKLIEACPQDVIEFFKDAASANQAEEALSALKGTLGETSMEPLVVALKIISNIPFHAPQEVVEVAKDIVKSINNKAPAGL
jgi:tetratricopeptide (TPR) repeat protein